MIYEREDIHNVNVKLPRGSIDDTVEHYFLNGQCHSMAYALHKKLNLPVVWLEHALYGGITHCAVKLPDGDILDVRGVRSSTFEGFIEHTCPDPKAFLDSCTEDAWVNDDDDFGIWMKPDLYLAHHYANIIIDKYAHDIAISMCA